MERFKNEMPIYISKRSSRDGWISFETDPYLTKTRKNIYGRCAPCLEDLYEQLSQGKKEIELKNAFDCWKIVAVANSIAECEEILRVYEENFPDAPTWGKFGSGDKTKQSKVVVFHAENEEDRDTVFNDLKRCLSIMNYDYEVFYSRACANIYGEVLGDWHSWQKFTPVIDDEKRAKILLKIKELLYYS